MTGARPSEQKTGLDAVAPALGDKLVRLEGLARKMAALAAELSAGLAEIRALGAGDVPPDVAADELVPIGYAAARYNISKEAARKQAHRMGLAIVEGGRVMIFRSSVDALYPPNVVRYSRRLSVCPSSADNVRAVSLPGGRSA